MRYQVRMKTGMSDGAIFHYHKEYTFENCWFDNYDEAKKFALELQKKYGNRRILPPLYYVMKFK